MIYIIKENRTYDQVLSDLKEGDGDPSLVFFPDTTIGNAITTKPDHTARLNTALHSSFAERFPWESPRFS